MGFAMRWTRIPVLFLTVIWALSVLVASAADSRVVVLTVKGAINPVVASYIDRGITQAESEVASAVVIQMDTPGGLDSSMREIVQRILISRVPVIVYVAPQGARAASAGTFILMAAHIAAMAPNTATGAAHPVAIGAPSTPGAPAPETRSPTEAKAENDAVAYIKSIAAERKRNADWAEKAVRESVSVTEQEALSLNVIDIVAPDVASLLAQAEGRQAAVSTGTVTLRTAGAQAVGLEMNFVERWLFTISDPNIAYILLSLAMTGLFLELANPGAILPGIVGGISLLLALFSLGMLPVNYAGVLLIVLAFILFVAEVFVTSHGMLAIGGVASLTIGSLILMSSSAPYFAIDRRLIAAVVLTISAFFVFVVGAIIRSHRRRASTGWEGLLGTRAKARTALNPEGFVFVEGERWDAISEDGAVEPGEEVIITKVDGLRLTVTRATRKSGRG
ncbi:MAG: nodulation protein NfeD [Chloroflexi bacterium]|nr:nodulation protein NfeD [Chloroflexota bacterium]